MYSTWWLVLSNVGTGECMTLSCAQCRSCEPWIKFEWMHPDVCAVLNAPQLSCCRNALHELALYLLQVKVLERQ